jgi:asparagine synthase (glutamine-hydrolysing)
MCGIAGILRVHSGGGEVPPPRVAIADQWLDLLDAHIAHRGPDGSGRFRDRARRADGAVIDIALVHRRLSIIDRDGGAQPMVAAAADVVGRTYNAAAVVFNGCIYNHRELRRELESLGHHFTTDHSDTEVLLHGQRAWGDVGLASRLDGMFAYAIWEREHAELVLARDRAGEKPLYEAELAPGIYAFASTAAALIVLHERLRSEGVVRTPLKPQPGGMAEWLRYGGSLTPMLGRLQELDVGVVARYGLHDLADGARTSFAQRTPFEKLPNRGDGPPLTSDSLDAMLRSAVVSRLEADVPLACFLSSGVDSSLVAAMAQRELGSLATFTVRMPDVRYDESEAAASVARALGTRHETLPCEASPAADLIALIEQLGLPFGDSSLLPTHWLSRAVRRAAPVALSGDGGDELFAGYERHAAARWIARFGGMLRGIPRAVGAGAHPTSRWSKLVRLGDAARDGYQELLAIFPRIELEQLVEGAGPLLPPPMLIDDAPRHDFRWYLSGDLMRKSDTASMAVALEVRSPLLATGVVRAALATGLESLTPGGRRKGLLREVAARYVPREVVDRRKMGFAIPVGEWLRSDFGGMRALMMDLIGERATDPFPEELLGLRIRRSCVAALVREHQEGVRDHSQRLYMLTVLAIWCRWRAGVARG